MDGIRFRSEVAGVQLVDGQGDLDFLLSIELLNPGGGGHVIQMPMGTGYSPGFEILSHHVSDELFRISTRVDDDAFFSPCGEDKSVRAQVAYNDAFNHATVSVRDRPPKRKQGPRLAGAVLAQLLLIGGLMFLFFLLIPGAGAFAVRARWRRFRSLVIAASYAEPLSYADIREDSSSGPVRRRIIGEIQAQTGEDQWWISNRDVSVRANLHGAKVYVLPSFEGAAEEEMVERNRELIPEVMPREMTLRNLGQLPLGTSVLVFGVLAWDEEGAVMRAPESGPLLVLVFDGDEKSLLRRSIWTGRHLNEYWNSLTPVSLAAGSFAFLMMAYLFLQLAEMRPVALLALSGALVPLLPLLPPGYLFFAIYKRLWARGRYLRAERDLFRLPGRFQTGESLPGGGTYGLRVYSRIPRDRRGFSIRTPSFAPKGDEFYLHGAVAPGGPRKPKDPFVEYVLTPGDPGVISAQCGELARTYERRAAASYAAGFVMNLVMVYALFYFFLP